MGQKTISVDIYLESRARYQEAEVHYIRALHLQEQNESALKSDIAHVLNRLGNLSRIRNELEKAKQYYHQALPLLEKTVGPDHLDVAQVLHGLATVFALQECFDEAEPTLGPQHPLLAEALSGRAEIYRKQGR